MHCTRKRLRNFCTVCRSKVYLCTFTSLLLTLKIILRSSLSFVTHNIKQSQWQMQMQMHSGITQCHHGKRTTSSSDHCPQALARHTWRCQMAAPSQWPSLTWTQWTDTPTLPSTPVSSPHRGCSGRYGHCCTHEDALVEALRTPLKDCPWGILLGIWRIMNR